MQSVYCKDTEPLYVNINVQLNINEIVLEMLRIKKCNECNDPL